MEDFTMHNFFKQWAKSWPLTAAFVVIGLTCGITYSSVTKTTFTASTDILVTGASESITSKDYAAIVNSNNLITPAALESANLKDSGCHIEGSTVGSVVTIAATCADSKNADELSLEAADVFTGSIAGILHDEKVYAQVISTNGAAPDISTTTRILRIALPGLAGLALGAFIAFVKLDHATSKKKSRK